MDGLRERWPLAQTIEERVQARRDRALGRASSSAELGIHRFERWQASAPFSGTNLIDERLKLANFSRQEFVLALGEQSPTSATDGSDLPAWVMEIREALIESSQRGTFPWPPEIERGMNRRFLFLIEPLLERYLLRLEKRACALVANNPQFLLISERVPEVFLPQIANRFIRLLRRPLVLETNVFRMDGRLEGDDASERMADFARKLSTSLVQQEIFERYPVLARQCVTYCEEWLESSTELLERLNQDQAQIQETFGISELGHLVRMAKGTGDLHCGGRSVAIVEFDSGFRLVYKPHSLSLDCHFQSFVAWLNRLGQKPELRTRKILDRGNYGWTEYVPVEACQAPEEVERFYRRQGSWLAIFYALAATDFHHENIVAMGEHPMVVDLEALFHPRLPPSKGASADDFANAALIDSVISVKLLPLPVRSKTSFYDSSGIGAAPNQILPFEAWVLREGTTDELHLAREKSTSGDVHNRPILNGRVADPSRYAEAIEGGFCDTYRLLLTAREDLLAEDGVLCWFRSDRVRVIIRATNVYLRLLTESFHPQALHDARERDLILDHLWSGAEKAPWIIPLISAERRQLLSGNIPYFSAQASSVDVEAGDGTSFPNQLVQSGLSLARSRISRMGSQDLALQRWLIRASLAALDRGREGADRGTEAQGKRDLIRPKPRPHDTFLAAARTLGDRFAELCMRGGGDASWLSLNFEKIFEEDLKESFRVGVAGNDLYSGLPGIIFFLAYLDHALGGGTGYRDLAEAGFDNLERRRKNHEAAPAIGAFYGLAGSVYLRMHLGVLWRRSDIWQSALALLPEISSRADTDLRLDVISGSAGCIPVLLGLSLFHPESSARQVANSLGERLLRLSRAQSQGVAWEGLPNQRGFSHGTSGVSWALAELAARGQGGHFQTAALAANTWEESLLGKGQWSDESHRMGDGTSLVNWCHGAPGIALGRLSQYASNPLPQLRQQAVRALRETLASEWLPNESLCHGTLGNLETLIMASRVLCDNPFWKSTTEKRTNEVFRLVRSSGWRPAFPRYVQGLGLMTGLAGIGFGMLRAAYPEKIPSVLTLAPPLI